MNKRQSKLERYLDAHDKTISLRPEGKVNLKGIGPTDLVRVTGKGDPLAEREFPPLKALIENPTSPGAGPNAMGMVISMRDGGKNLKKPQTFKQSMRRSTSLQPEVKMKRSVTRV